MQVRNDTQLFDLVAKENVYRAHFDEMTSKNPTMEINKVSCGTEKLILKIGMLMI